MTAPGQRIYFDFTNRTVTPASAVLRGVPTPPSRSLIVADVAKTIDQLEATVGAVTYAANTNDSTVGDIAALFVTLRSQLDIDSGLPVDSPLRSGDEPESQPAPAKAKAAAKK